MQYQKSILLKDGRVCIIRNGTEADGRAVFECFNKTHGETDFLLSYPDENSMNADEERKYLWEKAESADETELVAEVGGTGLLRLGSSTSRSWWSCISNCHFDFAQ